MDSSEEEFLITGTDNMSNNASWGTQSYYTLLIYTGVFAEVLATGLAVLKRSQTIIVWSSK